MRVEQVVFTHYRLYEGRNVITFPQGEGKIHLVCGENGFGKTTLLQGLLWCLYGKHAREISKGLHAPRSSYQQELQRNMNHTTYARYKSEITPHIVQSIRKYGYSREEESLREITTYSVEMRFVNLSIPALPCHEVEVIRSYDILLEREELEIFIDGERNQLTEEVGRELFVHEFILHRDIAHFFFFDAEEIETFAQTHTLAARCKLNRAYSSVIGIRQYEELIRRLEGVRLRLRKHAKDENLHQTLTEYETLQHNTQTTVTHLQQKIETLGKHLAELQEEALVLRERLVRGGHQSTNSTIQTLKDEIAAYQTEEKALYQQLQEMMEWVPFALAGKVFMKGYAQAQHDQHAQLFPLQRATLLSVQRALEHMLEETIASSSQELQKAKSKVKTIIAQHSKTPQTHTQTPPLILNPREYAILDEVYKVLNTTFSEKFASIAERYKKTKRRYERSLRHYRQLIQAEEDVVIQELRQKEEAILQKCDTLIERKQRLHEQLGAHQEKERSLSDTVQQLSTRITVRAEDKAKDQLAEELINELRSFLDALREKRRCALENRILHILQTLMHKEPFIARVEIVWDADAMDVLLYDIEETVINKEVLSKGEKQLFAMAMLQALVEESGISFPLFIDSPLQKFDKQHAQRIITDFYPHISHQVVLFPLLHKELSRTEYYTMLPYIESITIIENRKGCSHFAKGKIKELFD